MLKKELNERLVQEFARIKSTPKKITQPKPQGNRASQMVRSCFFTGKVTNLIGYIRQCSLYLKCI